LFGQPISGQEVPLFNINSKKPRTLRRAALSLQTVSGSGNGGDGPFGHHTNQMRAIGTCPVQITDHLGPVGLQIRDRVGREIRAQ